MDRRAFFTRLGAALLISKVPQLTAQPDVLPVQTKDVPLLNTVNVYVSDFGQVQLHNSIGFHMERHDPNNDLSRHLGAELPVTEIATVDDEEELQQAIRQAWMEGIDPVFAEKVDGKIVVTDKLPAPAAQPGTKPLPSA